MADVFKQKVIKIEEKEDDKGNEYKLVTVEKKDGSTKAKKVYDFDLQEAFEKPGWYEITYDEETHYMTAAKSLDGAAPAKSQDKSPTKASTNGHANGAQDPKEARQILVSVVVKAAADVTAAEIGASKTTSFAANFQNILKVAEDALAPKTEDVPF